ncbi:MAG TPA: glycosyltransferase family 2 protein [Thermoanaerobaculia bacterium]|nr:glycosyltransferase family 2 protein [Thermoanaerobaculia bacterium]
MRLSLIVVSYNTRELLASCLDSLVAYLPAIEHEVCVVDNASKDGSAALVRERFPHVRVIELGENRGFAAAVNVGIAATSGRYVCWLNPDACLLNDGMGTLLDYLDAHERTGIVGPRILNPDGSVQHSSRAFPSYATALFNRNSLLTRFFPRNRFTRSYLNIDRDRDAVQETDWVSGACLLHRRELGLLDERFFLYMEDIDFCLRAHNGGWGVAYHPALRVMHRIGGSSRQMPVRRVVAFHRSIWRYYAKHFRRNLLLDAASAAVIWGRCAVMMLEAALFGQSDPHTIRRA